MNTQRTAPDIVRHSEPEGVPKPYWRNAPHDPMIRDYSYNAAILRMDGDVMRLTVPRAPWTFLIGFACLFLPSFVFVAWYFIPEPTIRLFFMIAGPLAAVFAFALIYWMQSYHEGLGDFLVIDRASRTMELPRSKERFPFAQVVCFQWIRGRTQLNMDTEVDLNLLVRDSGEIIRYHVMGNPSRRLVEQVISFSGIAIEEIDLGGRGHRDADIANAAG